MLSDLIVGKNFRYEVFLCKPYSEFVDNAPVYNKIACLTSCAHITSVKKEFKNVNELTFYINLYWDDIDSTVNEYFNLIEIGYVVLLQSYIDDTLEEEEYFHIADITPSGGTEDVKEVHCYSKEYLWNELSLKNFQDTDFLAATRKIYDGQTFDPSDVEKGGILDYILQTMLYNTWSVEYISPSIADRYRTFDISEQKLLDVVKYIESLYNCVFIFNNVKNTIEILSYDELPTETGLIISNKNYLKTISESIEIESIVTRLYVRGKDNASLHSQNITGQGYIDNFDLFKSTKFMSQGLIDALDSAEASRASNDGAFQSLLDDLYNAQVDLMALQTDLSNLNSELVQLQDKEDLAIKFVTCEGEDYDYWHTLVLAKETEISNKESSITSKQNDIQTINDSIADIIDTVSYENHLSDNQMKELLQFIKEDTVSCSTEDEVELMEFAKEILDLKSSLLIEHTLDIVDIFSCSDENYTWDKLKIGSLVDLQYDNLNISTKPRIISYTHNPTDHSLSNLTLSNKHYYEDEVSYISNLLAFSRKASTILDNERDNYKEYGKEKEDIVYDGDTIETSDNPVEMDDGSVLDRRGYYLRDMLDASGQMRVLGDRILFTRNNWATLDGISVAITSEGIFCEKLFIITNTSGSVIIDEDKISITDMALELLANNDKNIIYLNADVGIKIGQLNEETELYKDVFFVDTDGNLYLKNAYFINEDSSISISPDKIEILDGKIEIKNVNGQETILDAYGLDPKFVKAFKNMVWNSSFELFNPLANNQPLHWSGGESDCNSSFFDSNSMRLDVGVSSTSTRTINPQWYANVNDDSRVAFYKKGGELTVRILDQNDSPLTLYNDDHTEGVTSMVFSYNAQWDADRYTFHFTHGSSTNLQIEFTCTDTSNAVYIDAVSLEPDFTGKWASFYTDGPSSTSANSEGTGLPLEVFIQPAEPQVKSFGTLWVDTNESMDDVEFFTAEDKAKLDGISYEATKTEESTTEGNIVIDGVEIVVADISGLSQSMSDMETDMGSMSDDIDSINISLDGKQEALGYTPEDSANKGVANGYAGLNADGKLAQDLDASKIVSGTIDVARLPSGAFQSLIYVDDEDARFALTASTPNAVALNDTVQQLDTGVMYLVVDLNNLDSEDGYTEYTAGVASAVEWSGVLNKPPIYIKSEVDTLLDDKVDKVAGKALSTEDYTTTEKDKLSNIDANANNYVHPDTHLGTIILQDASHRFVTDAEKAEWNAKQDALPDKTDNAGKFLTVNMSEDGFEYSASTPLASDVIVVDTGSYYTSDNVEGALQEIGTNKQDSLPDKTDNAGKALVVNTSEDGYEYSSVVGSSGSDVVVSRNTVKITTDSSVVNTGISAYSSSTPSLFVFKNTVFIEEDCEYTISVSQSSTPDMLDYFINKISGQWDGTTAFNFIALTNVASESPSYNGNLINDSSISQSKLVSELQNKIDNIPIKVTSTITTGAEDYFFTVYHNKNTTDVIVQIVDDTNEIVNVKTKIPDPNYITIDFLEAQAIKNYKVIML